MPPEKERIRKQWMTHLCEDYGLEPFEAEVIYADVQLNFRALLRKLRTATHVSAATLRNDLADTLRCLSGNPCGASLVSLAEKVAGLNDSGDLAPQLEKAVRDLEQYCAEAGCDISVSREDHEQDDDI